MSSSRDCMSAEDSNYAYSIIWYTLASRNRQKCLIDFSLLRCHPPSQWALAGTLWVSHIWLGGVHLKLSSTVCISVVSRQTIMLLCKPCRNLGDTASADNNDRIAAHCALSTVSSSLAGERILSPARSVSREPTKESPAPVTFTTFFFSRLIAG